MALLYFKGYFTSTQANLYDMGYIIYRIYKRGCIFFLCNYNALQNKFRQLLQTEKSPANQTQKSPMDVRKQQAKSTSALREVKKEVKPRSKTPGFYEFLCKIFMYNFIIFYKNRK